MKKIFQILPFLTLLSCDIVFQEEDNKYSILDNQQKIVDIINGLYSRLVKVHNEDYFKALIRSDDVNFYPYYAIWIGGPGWGGLSIVSTPGSINPPIVTGTIYRNLYSLIITANKTIPQLSGIKDSSLLGEVYFLRAYAYFKLARLFGNPPLVDDAIVNYTIEKPGFLEVYQFIEKDLLKAIDLLPENFTNARIPYETPHKGTAKALLAELYLSWAGFPINDNSKYTDAARISGEIIQHADYYNFELLHDFADLWDKYHRHNKENIFGLFFNPEPDSTELQKKENVNTLSGYDFGYVPTFSFFIHFPENYRKMCSYPLFYWSTLEKKQIKFDPIEDPINYIPWVQSLKWSDRANVYENIHLLRWPRFSQNTIYLLRFAQTLLTFAESRARSGNLDDSAYLAVNRIRRRANNLDINVPSKFDLPKNLTTKQFCDSVVWERAWELSFEPDGRWFDIVRLNLKDKLPRVNDPYGTKDVIYNISQAYLTKEWYFYIIPAEDQLINPNLK